MDSARLKLVPRSEVEEMAEMLAAQGRRVRELEAKLSQETLEKENLKIDFQHLLDHLNRFDLNEIEPRGRQCLVYG